MNKKKPLDWGAISLDSLFTFERGKEKNMAALAEGSIPLISARKVNNGVKGFVSNPSKIILSQCFTTFSYCCWLFIVQASTGKDGYLFTYMFGKFSAW